MSVKANAPPVPRDLVPRDLPFGDSMSVRVTFSGVPAGSASPEVSLPVTLRDLARSAFVGASTVRVAWYLRGSSIRCSWVDPPEPVCTKSFAPSADQLIACAPHGIQLWETLRTLGLSGPPVKT